MAPYNMRPRRTARTNETPAQSAHRLASAHISRTWTDRMVRLPSRGIKGSSSNQCYRNSALQGILHNPKLINWLESHDPCTFVQGHTLPPFGNKKSKKGSQFRCVACGLRALSREYWRNKRSRVRESSQGMTAFSQALEANWTLPGWNWEAQQDATEYINELMNRFLGQSAPAQRTAELESIMCLQIRQRVECQVCHDVSIRDDPMESYIGLVPPTNENSFLSDLMRMNFSETVLEGSYCKELNCTSQNSRTERRSTRTLLVAPNVLVVEVFRFALTSWTNEGAVYTKNERRVRFGEYLNLSRYLDGNASGVTLRYRLVASVLQRGSMRAGHYKTVVRNADGQWYEMNDSAVRRVPFRDATFPTWENDGFTPYILFWERVDREVVDEEVIEKETVEEKEVEKLTADREVLDKEVVDKEATA